MSTTNEDTLKAYNSGVQAYLSQSPQEVSKHVKEWIDAALEGLPKTAKLFEIGSGTGKDARYIQSLGYKMALTDASKGFVEYLNQNGFLAKKFNVLTDDFDGESDLILADAVLLHFTEGELAQILNKISSALNASGRLAFSVKQGDGEFTETKKLGAERYFHLWQPQQLKQMLRDANLKITYQEIAEDNRGNKPGWILIVAQKQTGASK